MTEPIPDWVLNTPSAPIHQQPAGSELQRPFTRAQLLEVGARWLEGFIKEVVKALVGALIPGTPAFEQLKDWADNLAEQLEDIPIIGDIIEILTGVEDGDENDLGSFGLRVRRSWTRVPVGALTDEAPNLFTAPTFPTGSIPDNPDWAVDLTSTRSSDGSGAAKVVADGTVHALRSGRNPSDVIPVGEGQVFTASVFVSHEDYAGSGAPILLQVVPYSGGAPGTPVTLLTESSTPTNPEGIPAAYPPAGPDLGWPGYELGGSYVVPAGVTGVQTRILVTENATAGTFWFDDATAQQTGLLRQEWVDGLPESLQDIIGRIQLFIDTVFNTLTGGTSVLNSLEDLAEALLHIPPGNVDGVNGPADIGASILALLNNIVGGLVGAPGEGASNADAFNIARIISSRASRGADAWEVLGYRNNTPVDNGLLPSSEANYNLTVVNADLPATQAASLIGVIRVQRSAPLGVVSWLGYGTTNVTAFYVNIWKIDPTSGDWSLQHHSDNIVGDLESGATPQWNFYNLDPPLARVQGEDYAYELVPVGSGTHTVRGFSTGDDIPDHPYAHVVALAATRDNSSDPDDPPSTIAKASVVRSGSIPWIETAIDTGNSSDIHDPVTVYFTESGSVPIPNWANYIDRIALGGGGGARRGTVGFHGQAGEAGSFNADTLERGVDFDSSDTVVTFTRGDGGDDGVSSGEDGGDSSFTVGENTVTAAGGDGGTELFFATSAQTGYGPGTFEYLDETYVGGADQYASGSDGAAPGGGGSGGNAWGFQNGGSGAPGAGWVVFRADPAEGTAPDTTPPTAPTLTLDEATYSTLTVIATGATD